MKIVAGVASLGAAAAVVLLATAPFSPTNEEAKENPLAAYTKLIEELDHRKRVNVLFPNPQSIFDGYHIGFVNVSAGNLTFRRRDLVTRAAGTVVEFTRVYDSRIQSNDDFGAGWRLSLAEEVTLDDGALVYVDRAGARHRFASEDGVEFRASPMTPRHSQTRVTVTEKEVAVSTKDGALRTFEPQPGQPPKYVISTLKSANGGELAFRYQDGLISSVYADGARVFTLARDTGGKVASVQDHHGRAVSYSYTADGRLKDVIDIGGNLWWHEYGEFGLTNAVGPNRQPFLVVRYQDAKVTESRSGHSYAFAYRHDRTDVTDGSGVQRSFFNEESGATYRLASSDGTDWRLTLGPRNEVTELRTATTSHTFWYDAKGRLEKMHRSSPDGSQDLALTYEGARLVRILSGDDTTRIDYDGDTTRLSTPSTKVEFTVDGGRVQRADSQVVRPDLLAGRTVSVAYSESGDVSAIESRTKGMPDPQGAHFMRNALGQIINIEYASGFESTYKYDALGNRVSSRHTGGGSQHYTLDPSGNIVTISSSSPNGSSGTQSYVIGEMNRVTRITNVDGGKSMDIDYDSNGNAVQFKTDDDTVHARYKDGYRLDRIWSSKTGVALVIDDDTQYEMEVDFVHERTPAKREVLTRKAFDVQQTQYGTVVFDMTSHAAFPADPVEAHVPHYSDAMAALDLAGAFAGGGPVADFDKPSNPAFHPPEYRSINCCIPCATVGCSCTYTSTFSPRQSVAPLGCGCLIGLLEWLIHQGHIDATSEA